MKQKFFKEGYFDMTAAEPIKFDSVIDEIIYKLKLARRKPVLLHGYVQSGKTHTYLSTMKELIEQGYSKFIVITKNSINLAKQTEERVIDFFDEDENKMQIINVKSEYEGFAKYEFQKINVFILKKHTRDFEKLQDIIEKHPSIRNDLGLIIDDESDEASVNHKTRVEKDILRAEKILYKAICQCVTDLRDILPRANFLIVTATPFVHYLSDNVLFRPHSVVLLKPHNQYFGGKQLFFSNDSKNVAIRENFVSEDEFSKISEFSVQQNDLYREFPKIAEALMAFYIGGIIRHIQLNEKYLKHFSMLIHIDTHRAEHNKQEALITNLIASFLEGIKKDDLELMSLINAVYANLKASQSVELQFPSLIDVMKRLPEALEEQSKIKILNSDNKIGIELYKGAIKNSVPFSIFIGALAVERGITFKNLISFVFGRARKTIAADSSLQQLRIFGARDPDDLNVTRLYSTEKMVDNWRELCKIEEIIRENIELLVETMNTVQTSDYAKNLLNVLPLLKNQMIYTSSSKLPLGQKSFKEYSRILPTAFNTISDDNLALKITEENLAIIESLYDKYELEHLDKKNSYITIHTDEAINLLLKVYSALQSQDSKELFGLELSIFVLKIFKEQNKEKVHIYTKYNRNRKATKIDKNNNIVPDNSPDSGETGDHKKSQKIAQDYPVLMLLHQEGKVEDGFNDVPFIWPVLCLPQNLEYGFLMRGKFK